MDPRSEEAQAYFPVVQAMAAERGIAQALWLWKEDSQDSWGIFDFNVADDAWQPREAALDLVEVPYAMAVPGRLLSHVYDDESRTLTVRFEAAGGEGPPVLYLPERVYPSGSSVTLNGVAVGAAEHPSSQRYVVQWAAESGVFELVVAPQ